MLQAMGARACAASSKVCCPPTLCMPSFVLGSNPLVRDRSVAVRLLRLCLHEKALRCEGQPWQQRADKEWCGAGQENLTNKACQGSDQSKC